MGFFYQTEDAHLLDYQMTQFHGEWFRGPLDTGPEAIAWIGAAQTFGRFVAEPFPWLVGARLGLGTLNLGSGGKGPEYFLRHPELLDEVNSCRAAVVQVMAARTGDNRLFRSNVGGDSGVRQDTGEQTKSIPIIEELLAAGRRREARQLVHQSQESYVRSMVRLLDAIQVPTVLLWIAFRAPPPTVLSHRRTLHNPPQLTTRGMVRRIRRAADHFEPVVSRIGVPEPLVDREGKPAGENGYYPSPEMHRLAADRLTPVLADLIGRTRH
jgi:Domain of unknown function (DUF6473)